MKILLILGSLIFCASTFASLTINGDFGISEETLEVTKIKQTLINKEMVWVNFEGNIEGYAQNKIVSISQTSLLKLGYSSKDLLETFNTALKDNKSLKISIRRNTKRTGPRHIIKSISTGL